jgi:hypothetical protein
VVVELTDGDGSYYRGNLFYDLAKTSTIRLAYGMAQELRPHGVGGRRHAGIHALRGRARPSRRDRGDLARRNRARDRHFEFSETPRFVGRAIAALAADPDVTAKSGHVLTSWDLAKEYGFTDVEGARPDWGAYLVSRGGPRSELDLPESGS